MFHRAPIRLGEKTADVTDREFCARLGSLDDTGFQIPQNLLCPSLAKRHQTLASGDQPGHRLVKVGTNGSMFVQLQRGAHQPERARMVNCGRRFSSRLFGAS